MLFMVTWTHNYSHSQVRLRATQQSLDMEKLSDEVSSIDEVFKHFSSLAGIVKVVSDTFLCL